MSAFRKLLWPGVATAVALAILLSLGTWQMFRRLEKGDMLAALNNAITARPTALDADLLKRIQIWPAGHSELAHGGVPELTRVSVSGSFLPARSVPVRATLPATKGAPVSGIGFFWMTPLQLADGSIVFINRGFVPSGGDWKPPAVPTPEGERSVSGLLRLPERGRAFTPADNPAKGEYFSRDPGLMAAAAGLPADKVANLFIDAERTPGSVTPPVGVDPREMIARIPNNHLQYAVTWFGLAATLIGVFAFFARSRLRETA
ncbi:MAG: SURF1 family protein [Beijerinckiaceae bacterium]